MRRSIRLGILAGTVAIFTALTMVAASADTGSGQGQTPLSASLGFNVHDNGVGDELNYNADPNGPNAGFSVHCSAYTTVFFGTNNSGYPIVKVTATQGECIDQNGNPVYLRASFTDKGEPGTNDVLCVMWSSVLPVKKNAFIHDMGAIQNGNIQINTNIDGSHDALMLSS